VWKANTTPSATSSPSVVDASIHSIHKLYLMEKSRSIESNCWALAKGKLVFISYLIFEPNLSFQFACFPFPILHLHARIYSSPFPFFKIIIWKLYKQKTFEKL
jgi:hypothetical protein